MGLFRFWPNADSMEKGVGGGVGGIELVLFHKESSKAVLAFGCFLTSNKLTVCKKVIHSDLCS